MNLIRNSLSVALIVFISACSTTSNISPPVIAAAKEAASTSQTENTALNEKDFRFIAPTGFKGPATISKSKYSRLVAFSSTRENGTVITVHSGYSKTPLWDPSPEMQRSVVGKYLTKMISGIENRRTNYEQDDIEFFEISGIQVGKASWTGDTDKGSMQGTMYSFLKSGNNHTFAVQGFSHNTSSLNKAYDAVENLRIRN